MHFEDSIEIAAPLERVWNVISDVERWHEWTASITEVKLLTSGPFAVGTQALVRQPKLRPATWLVTLVEPGVNFEWVNSASGVTSVAAHRVEPAGSGSRATLTIDSKGLLVPVMALFYRGLVRRYMRLEAEGLKRRCEQQT